MSARGTIDISRPNEFTVTTKLMVVAALWAAFLLGVSFAACASAETSADTERSSEVERAQAGTKAMAFANPQAVTIVGYSRDAMEPFLTRDGNFLFFNNSNDPSIDTNLFRASKVDDLTFRYQGEIGGVNSTALDAVASMDLNHTFYFISTRSYSTTASTIYWGSYAKGAVKGVALVPGVSRMKPGIVDFDAEISADGNTLYFSEGVFTGGSVPKSAQIMIAHRDGNSFTRDPNSKTIMREINTGQLDYAADTSASELEIFFTRLTKSGPAIFMATRTSTAKAFGAPAKINAISGFAEAPSISPDDKSLYFHEKNPNGVFSIYRVTRP
ncbi:MAG: hypothetical protein ACLQDV_16410 [Candidatus Binataceae bacterium]